MIIRKDMVSIDNILFFFTIVQFYDPIEEVNYNKQKPPLVIYEGYNNIK